LHEEINKAKNNSKQNNATKLEMVHSEKKVVNEGLIASSNSMILPEYIGQTIFIYNGMNYRGIKIDEDKVGLKFGEFIFTKKRAIYKRKKKGGKSQSRR
jgi:ribosomal protein S19